MASKAEIEEERANFINKFFDCAEAPIKEWLAEYVEKDVLDVFPDFKDVVDVIGFQHDDKHYNAYLVAMPSGTDSLVPKSLLLTNEKAKKACSMLYDAVLQVFMAVVNSSTETIFKSLIPRFDESKMAFYLTRVNLKAMQLQTANQQNVQIRKFLEESKESITPEHEEALINTLKQIAEIFKTNTKEILDAEEKACVAENKANTNKPWMHIVVEEANELDESLKRLPTFGLQYQDPDEETYIDKLKKEYDVLE